MTTRKIPTALVKKRVQERVKKNLEELSVNIVVKNQEA